MTKLTDLLWRLRYTLAGQRYFGWSTAWAFSLPWCNDDLDRDGYTPSDAVYEDLQACL